MKWRNSCSSIIFGFYFIILIKDTKSKMNKPDINKLYRTQLSEKYFRNSFPEYIEFLYSKYPDMDWKDKLYCDQHNLDSIPVCPICGKPVKLLSMFKGYLMYCSNKCATSDPMRQEKIQKTTFERYGVRHALQSDQIKEKFKQTCIEKFGTDNPTKNQSVALKAQQTMISRYGGIGSASPELNKRSVKSRRTNRLKSSTIPNQLGYTDDGQWIMKCAQDNTCEGCDGTYYIWSGNYFDRMKLGHELCTKLNPVDPNKVKDTTIELFIRDILDAHNIRYRTNVRDIISPKEIDIYCPDYKIAIECNGVYWHSMKHSSYHREKFDACESQGIQLLMIWEDWVRNKSAIVESLVLSKFGIYRERIGARECKVVDVSSKMAQKFFEDNHIQGRCKSKVRLGLECDGRLVAVMAFDNRSKLSGGSKTEGWELIRFCGLINLQVIGGAERLLKHFISRYNPAKIVSFSSNDISTGSLYKRLKFRKYSSSLAYWYIQQETFKRYHRTSFCKTRLAKMGMDTSKTEREIMESLPYWRIYDSGTTGWELNVGPT